MPKYSLTSLINGLVLLISIMVMLGWFLGIPALVQIQPQFVPMQFNTAMCFFLLSFAAIILCKHQKLSIILLTTVLFLSFFSGLQYVIGVSFGIDELLMKHTVTVNTSHPGRMAPNTALGFVLFSFSLLLYSCQLRNQNSKKLKFIVGFILTILVFSISLVALVGYLFDLKTTYSWRNLTAMAVHTAIGFFLLSINHLYKLNQIDHKIRFKHYKLVLFGGVILVLVIWQLIEVYLISNLSKDVQFKNTALITQSEEAIYGYTTAIDRFFSRYEMNAFDKASGLEQDAAFYLKDMPSIEVIDLGSTAMFPDGKVFKQNSLSEVRAKTYIKACQKQKKILKNSRVIYTEEGQTTLICMYSESHNSLFVINTLKFIGLVVSSHLSNDIGLKILHDKKVIIDNSNRLTLSDDLVVSNQMRFLDEMFIVIVTPTDSLLKERVYLLSNTSLVVALLLVILLTIAIYFYEVSLISLKNEKKIRNHLEREEEKNRLILNYAGEGIYGVDCDGRTTFINPAANNMLGYSDGELIDHKLHQIIHHTYPDGEPYPEDKCPIYQAFKDGQKRHLESEVFFRKDGSYFPVEYSSRPMYNGQNEIVGAVVTFIDITKRKMLERLLSERRLALENTNKELESFSYSVSHDLKAPLRHIKTFIQMLSNHLGEKIDADTRHYVDVIEKSVQKMSTLIEGLLNFSKTGRVEMNKKLVDIQNMVAEIVNEKIESYQGIIPIIQQHTLSDVMADPVLLRTVWTNLIENAFKFSSKETYPEITIGCQESSEEVVFFVQDNGVGFDEKYKDKLFGVFQRLHQNKDFPGTGIGLANVARIIARHGGRVWAEGSLNKGACIYFSLPKNIEGLHEL